MAINRVEIKDFLVFKGEFALDFCPGVNVLIGGNATGKTTLLKCFYAATNTIGYEASHYFDSPELKKEQVRIARIINIPINPNMKLDNLPPVAVYMSSPDEWDNIDKEFYSKIDEIASHSEEGKKLNEDYLTDPLTFNVNKKSVYIPEKDILSNSKGLPESVMYGKAQFTVFDVDIITKARVLASVPEQPLYRSICDLIGGEPEHDGQSFFMKRCDIAETIPFSMEASGYRKLGLLALLIRNEMIQSESILLWDEPENSLNPDLIPKLVDILLELSRNRVQVFLATHSEVLASYINVLRESDDKVMFFSLYKEEDKITYDIDERFDLLKPNNLIAEQAKLHEKEVERVFG